MGKKANITQPYNDQNRKNHEDITIDDIRKIERFRHLTDLEAERLLRTVKAYISLVAGFFTKLKSK